MGDDPVGDAHEVLALGIRPADSIVAHLEDEGALSRRRPHGDGREDALLRRLLRDEGGHPAQRGLLVRQDTESIVPEDEPADGAPLGIA
jgi:hypothetical protein